MGLIISRFKKRANTQEILEGLEVELKSLQKRSFQTEQRYRRIVGNLLVVSVGLYVMLAGLFYFVFFPASLYDQLLYVVPLLLFPLIIVFLKRGISWWYYRKISKDQNRLAEVQKKKKQLLEEVMDKETYKVARLILEKYAPDQLRKGTSLPCLPVQSDCEGPQIQKVLPKPALPIAANAYLTPNVGASSELRHRYVTSTPVGQFRTPAKQMVTRISAPISTPGPLQSSVSGPLSSTGYPMSQPKMMRPILPQNRSVLDRLVEYIVGDGVNQRYALICKKCNSHNGMALKEEFEFLAFRCCYCSDFNPARKQRLQPPKLENLSAFKADSSTSGESRHTSEEEEEEEGKKDLMPPPDALLGLKEKGKSTSTPNLVMGEANKLKDTGIDQPTHSKNEDRSGNTGYRPGTDSKVNKKTGIGH